MNSCSYCGRENPDGIIFCGECGTPLQASSKPAESPTPGPGLKLPKFEANPTLSLLRRNKKVLLVLAVALLGIALWVAFNSSESPELDTPEVIKIADAVALHAGFSLNAYTEPVAKFEPGNTTRVWRVLYQKKPPSYSEAARPEVQNAPRTLMVVVDDKTKQTQLAISRGAVGGGTTKIPPHLKATGSFTQAADGTFKGE
jgi:hypothetical protein